MVNNDPKITGSEAVGPKKSMPQPSSEESTPSKSFDSYMKTPDQNASSKTNQAGKPSPMDLAQQASAKTSMTTPTMDSVMNQMKSTSSVLGDLQNQLNTKNLRLKQSHKYLLSTKLRQANNSINEAAKKAGVKDAAQNPRFKKTTPIEKFLSYVTSGQQQLDSAQSLVAKLNSNGQQMNPGDLLMIQIKLSKAQQELEYSSVLLSKAVDDIKQMFNIQI